MRGHIASIRRDKQSDEGNQITVRQETTSAKKIVGSKWTTGNVNRTEGGGHLSIYQLNLVSLRPSEKLI